MHGIGVVFPDFYCQWIEFCELFIRVVYQLQDCCHRGRGPVIGFLLSFPLTLIYPFAFLIDHYLLSPPYSAIYPFPPSHYFCLLAPFPSPPSPFPLPTTFAPLPLSPSQLFTPIHSPVTYQFAPYRNLAH